jgi:ribosomal protein S18 acetylase RimI-like enzyme
LPRLDQFQRPSEPRRKSRSLITHLEEKDPTMATVQAASDVAILEDSWLARVFGYDVFRVEPSSIASEDDARDSVLAGEIREHFQVHARAFYYAKVVPTRTSFIRQLHEAGFRIADVNVTLSLDTSQQASSTGAPHRSRCEVGAVRREDESPVVEIARACFRYSRFHLDPYVPRATADAVKAEWVRSYLEGRRGDRLFIARADDQPVGFLAALVQDDSAAATAVVDLIGVATTHQGRGIGEALVRAFADYYRNRCGQLQIGTQVANIASLRMCQKCGFSVTGSTYVFHKHIL